MYVSCTLCNLPKTKPALNVATLVPEILLDFHLIFKSRKTSENRVKRIINLCCFYLLCKKRQTNIINNSIEQNLHWTKKITSASSTSGHHMIRSKINAV